MANSRLRPWWSIIKFKGVAYLIISIWWFVKWWIGMNTNIDVGNPSFLLVGGLEHFFFPSIGNSNPNWLIFFRGVETTNQFRLFWRNYWFSRSFCIFIRRVNVQHMKAHMSTRWSQSTSRWFFLLLFRTNYIIYRVYYWYNYYCYTCRLLYYIYIHIYLYILSGWRICKPNAIDIQKPETFNWNQNLRCSLVSWVWPPLTKGRRGPSTVPSATTAWSSSVAPWVPWSAPEITWLNSMVVFCGAWLSQSETNKLVVFFLLGLPGLVNVYIWKDPENAMNIWVDQLFRLGHFQCRKLWMFTRGFSHTMGNSISWGQQVMCSITDRQSFLLLMSGPERKGPTFQNSAPFYAQEFVFGLGLSEKLQ